MTSLCIQAWPQLLSGVQAALAHTYVLELLRTLRAVGDSCRSASPGIGSSALYGRFTIIFCRSLLADMLDGQRLSKLRSYRSYINAGFIAGPSAKANPN